MSERHPPSGAGAPAVFEVVAVDDAAESLALLLPVAQAATARARTADLAMRIVMAPCAGKVGHNVPAGAVRREAFGDGPPRAVGQGFGCE